MKEQVIRPQELLERSNSLEVSCDLLSQMG